MPIAAARGDPARARLDECAGHGASTGSSDTAAISRSAAAAPGGASSPGASGRGSKLDNPPPTTNLLKMATGTGRSEMKFFHLTAPFENSK